MLLIGLFIVLLAVALGGGVLGSSRAGALSWPAAILHVVGTVLLATGNLHFP